MKKVTTTSKVRIALNEGIVDNDSFKESLDFLCKSGIFADALGWHYETDTKTNGYIAETGRMNPDSEIIITVYLDVCESASREDVERTLRFAEEEINDKIIVNNKFEVGQTVYYIGRKCSQYGKKKKFVWTVKSKEPIKVLCIHYRHKLIGDPELTYNIERYGKVKEEHLFTDYESAYVECDKRNKLEEELKLQKQ